MALMLFSAISRDPGSFVPFAVALVLLVGLAVGLLWLLSSGKRRRLRALWLSDVDRMTGHQFEHYVAALLKHQGYQTTVTQGSGDLGGDVIARKGDLRYIVQTKRYSNGVSRTAVSDAVAAMAHYKCNACMVVTTHYFTAGARQLAKSNGCVLADRDTLAEWIVNFQTASSHPPTKSVPGL